MGVNRNEVLTALNCCKQGTNYADAECGSCPYKDAADCYNLLAADACAYIQISEDARKHLVEKADEMLATLKDLPDVVRCGECRYWDSDTLTHFWKPCDEIKTDKDWFCACGKRRDE